jgi:hypothetical protein
MFLAATALVAAVVARYLSAPANTAIRHFYAAAITPTTTLT